MSKRLHPDARDSCLFPPFFVCHQDPCCPKCMVSCQSGGSCFSLSVQSPPLFTRCMVSCHLAHAPLSLLTSSYLSALTLLALLLASSSHYCPHKSSHYLSAFVYYINGIPIILFFVFGFIPLMCL